LPGPKIAHPLLASVLALIAIVLSVGAFAASGQTGSLEVAGFGGIRGTEYAPRKDGDTLEYSEVVTIDFTQPVDYKSLLAHLSVSPQAPFQAVPSDYGKRIAITMRKTPGIAYTIGFAPGMLSTSGVALERPVAYHFSTAPVPKIPTPIRATPGEPYRYGALAHPFPGSLGGSDAGKVVDLFAEAGVRFVRIDYCGDQNLGGDAPKPEPDFTIQDAILDKLMAKGITELPIVDQYCAPKWATGGRGFPAIYNDPADYARYAGAIASHLAQKYPKVTRIELFNEPNIDGWWAYVGPSPAYADRFGSAAAAYMKAAYAAVKRAAPKVTVVGPALADGGHDSDPRKFFRAMYAAGCRRGVCWDVISVHNYRWFNPDFIVDASAQNRFDVYKDLQEIARENGDPDTHVMLTEWAFSTAPVPDGFDPRVQAQYIAIGFNRMLADPTVDGIVYYNLYDNGKAGSFWVDARLVGPDLVKTPGFDVFRQFAKR
jgi:hypothetical protein